MKAGIRAALACCLAAACAPAIQIEADPPVVASFSVASDDASLLVPELAELDAETASPAQLEAGAEAVNDACESEADAPCIQGLVSAAGGKEVVLYRHGASSGSAAGAAVLESSAETGQAFDWLLNRTRGRVTESTAETAGPAVRTHYLAERPNPVPEQPTAKERAVSKDRESAAAGDWKWAFRQINYFEAEKLLAERLRLRTATPPVVTVAQLDTGYTPNCQFADKEYQGAACGSTSTTYPILDVDRSRDFFSNPLSSSGIDPQTPATWVPESRQPGHGTRTGSVIASPRGIGVCKPKQEDDKIWGTAPTGVKVVPVRVTDGIILGLPKSLKTAFPPLDHRVLAVSLGVEHVSRKGSPYFTAPVQLISMSMGGESDPGSGRLKCVVDKAERNGVIIVAAAGQFPAPGLLKWLFFRGKQPVAFPARWASTIAVAGSNILGTPWGDSCRGPEVDVTAPAEYVWRADTKCGEGESIGMGRGTSFATALTAGVAAMWVQYHGYDALTARYGRAITSALRWLLINKGTRTPAEYSAALDNESDIEVAPYRPLVRAAVADHKWSKKEFASGLLDAQRLLEAELPTLAEVCLAEKGRRTADEFRGICQGDFSRPIPIGEDGWEECAGRTDAP